MLSTKYLSYNAEKKLFSIEASTASAVETTGHDHGTELVVKSHRTGVTKLFRFLQHWYNPDHELLYTDYYCAPYTLRIFND